MLHAAVEWAPLEVGQSHTFRREDGHVAVHQEENVARVVQNRRNIGSDEVLVVAQPDYGRRSRPDSHDLIRFAFRDDGQGKYAADLVNRRPDGVLENGLAVLVMLLD